MPSTSLAPAADADFATLLRERRRAQRMSQMALALTTGVSTRHLGFLEVQRAKPSRTMVLALAQALDVPLRERNQWLAAAGFAALYRESPLEGSELQAVQWALDFMLRANEPHPCFVVNRRYDVLRMNDTARWLLQSFVDDAALVGEDSNMVTLLTAPKGMGAHLRNPHEVLRKVLGRVRRDLGALRWPDQSDTRVLAEAEAAWVLLGDPPPPDKRLPPVVGLQLAREGRSLDFFTTIATLGTPMDITLHDLRIETLFPADAATREFLAARYAALNTTTSR